MRTGSATSRPRYRRGSAGYGTSAARKKARTCSRRCSSARGSSGSLSSRPPRNGASREVAEQGAVPGEQQLLGVLRGGTCRRPSPGRSSRRPGRTSGAARRRGRCRGGRRRRWPRGAPGARSPGCRRSTSKPARRTSSTFSQPCCSAATAASRRLEPVGQQELEHLAVQRLLGREVVQQAGPTDADAGGDVVERRALVAGGREADDRLVEDRLAGACGSSGRRRRAGVDDRVVRRPFGLIAATTLSGRLPTGR